MQYVVLSFYILGIAILVGVAIHTLALRPVRHLIQKNAFPEVTKLASYRMPNVLAREDELLFPSPGHGLDEVMAINKVRELALDTSVGILQATRKSEKKLAKSEAQELLHILRDELGVAEGEVSPEQSIETIRRRLMSLTEMMAEAQLALCDLDHRVIDVETIVEQLPDILQGHRDHICSLREAVAEVQASAATKSELSTVERDLATIKWAFITIFGVVFTVLGWLVSRVF